MGTKAAAPRPVDRKRGTVHLYSREACMPQRVNDCVRNDTRLITHDFHKVPVEHVDYYIVASLNITIEREAARLQALPVVLPAAQDWLAAKIDAATKSGRDVVLMMRRMP